MVFFPLLSMEISLPSYDIPYDTETGEAPGGAILLDRPLGRHKVGDEVTVYTILKIPLQSNPAYILAEWEKLYGKIMDSDDTSTKKQLVLEAARRLNLPIPPESRDTSSTPNYDAFMADMRATYRSAREHYIHSLPSRAMPADGAASEVSTLASDEETPATPAGEQGWCALI